MILILMLIFYFYWKFKLFPLKVNKYYFRIALSTLFINRSKERYMFGVEGHSVKLYLSWGNMKLIFTYWLVHVNVRCQLIYKISIHTVKIFEAWSWNVRFHLAKIVSDNNQNIKILITLIKVVLRFMSQYRWNSNFIFSRFRVYKSLRK
jgi:hypothetical protein